MKRMMLRRRVLMASLMNSGLPLSDLPEGSLVAINESGSPVLFYLAKHDYESGLNGAGRTLLVRKDCYDTRVWHSSNNNAYATSDIDSWLNGDYKALLDYEAQAAIGTTQFYYTNPDKEVTTLDRSIFLLSVTELGKTANFANVEGTSLPIASTLQIANLNGSSVIQWTRTRNTYGTTSAYSLKADGTVYTYNCSKTECSRPCFTLPADATVNPEPNADGSYTLTI